MSRNSLTPAIRFGTDGWRARIAHDFTFANLERVAQAYADYLIEQHLKRKTPVTLKVANEPHVIIGYDRRFLSEHFAARVADVLAANNLRVARFMTDVPTPLVSWTVREKNWAGGVVITASHNPPDFNGFKIKDSFGGSAAPETTAAVEKLIDATPPRPRRATLEMTDQATNLDDAVTSYRAQIASYVDLERIKKSSASIIVDPMHGTGGCWVESFLTGGVINVETIRAMRDPLFGGVNPEPIDRNLAPLKKRVTEKKALIGLATDGDADRLGAVNELGQTMTMHEVVPLLLLHLARRRRMTGGVVRTFSQSVLIKRLAAAHNLKLYETPIGFKYIAELMLSEDILLGAEESGGIGVKGHIPERDGILNSLLLLEAVIEAGQSPSEIVREIHREFGAFFFNRRDLHMEVARGVELVAQLAAQPPAQFAGYQVTGIETLDGTKLLFADESWLLFRQSGTEPVLRIYAEATSAAKTEELLAAGQALAHENY